MSKPGNFSNAAKHIKKCVGGTRHEEEGKEEIETRRVGYLASAWDLEDGTPPLGQYCGILCDGFPELFRKLVVKDPTGESSLSITNVQKSNETSNPHCVLLISIPCLYGWPVSARLSWTNRVANGNGQVNDSKTCCWQHPPTSSRLFLVISWLASS